jgi:hypothetical protein
MTPDEQLLVVGGINSDTGAKMNEISVLDLAMKKWRQYKVRMPDSVEPALC